MPDQRRIGFAIKSVSNLAKQCIDQTIASHETQGVTGMQGWIIGYLYHHKDEGDIFQHDLELEFNIRRSTASGILQRMERDGLIVRTPVASDARCKKVTLTPKAIGIHENVMHAIDQVEESITAGLSENEIETLFRILGKIRQNLAPPSSPADTHPR
ncbi:MAG TPA: MarR family winged helix-turn-helix transcriptional regulator [Candidatus Limiplasma sp.]|nr:MarR family winged helix-turn-helix transcriptional regulator [Candidatus Limiplasma sp.]